jgi:hypothetical protein
MTLRVQRMAREADLNERQRTYLLGIFEVDQSVEAEMRQLPYRPFQPRPKASEWRWLEYSEPLMMDRIRWGWVGQEVDRGHLVPCACW